MYRNKKMLFGFQHISLLSQLVALVLVLSSHPAIAADCNGNGIEDAIDISTRDLALSAPTGVLLPNAIITAANILDIDLDNRDDLVIAGRSSTIVNGTIVQFKKSAFALQNGPSYGLSQQSTIGFEPTAIGLGDFDSNGFIDIGLSDGSSQTVLANQGNNSFIPLSGQPLSGLPSTPPLVDGSADQQSGDLNGDGRDDLLRVSGNKVEILLRNAQNILVSSGEVTFEFPSFNCLGLSRNVDLLPLRDLDSDGDLDPIAISQVSCPAALSGLFRETSVKLLRNNGSAQFTESEERFSGAAIFSQYRDLVRDGVPDLVFSFRASNGCNGPVAFCGGSPEQVGITVLPIGAIITSLDNNGNGVPDQCERAVPGDFDGDRVGDFAAVRPVNGLLLWLLRPSFELPRELVRQELFGLAQFDRPYSGDFDGNGKFEPAVIRDAGDAIPSLFGLWWYNLKLDGSAEAVQFGLRGDQPVTGHFDSDTKTDRVVVRNQLGQLVWYIFSSKTNSGNSIPWGLSGDAAFSADVTGDGIDELIVARNFLGGVYWFIRTLDGGFRVTVPWGLAGDTALKPADVDGDGRADLAVVRRSGRFLVFYIRFADGTSRVVNFGLVGDTPQLSFVGGGNNAEPSLIRPAPTGVFLGEVFHYQRTSSGVISTVNRNTAWGFAGDTIIRADGLGIAP